MVGNKEVNVWVTGLDLGVIFLNKPTSTLKFCTINNLNKHTTEVLISHNKFSTLHLFLKTSLNNLWFNVDLAVTKANNFFSIHSANSCFLSSERLHIVTYPDKSLIQLSSISSIFQSATWVERELQEFNGLTFKSLRDSRRLLTDYTYHTHLYNETYKTTSYDQITQDLYIRMLHWLFCFTYCFLLVCLSFLIYNKSLLQLLVLSEVLIILLAMCAITISLLYNIYFLSGFVVIILIFGGLELSINLLMLTLVDTIYG